MNTNRTALGVDEILLKPAEWRYSDYEKAKQQLLADILSLPCLQNVLEQPRLRQYETRNSAPFFCSICGMGEMTIMDNKEGDKYFCRCSYWSDPHNAYIDKSGGNWLGWKSSEAAQEAVDSQPTISVKELRQALQDYFMGGDVGVDKGDSDSKENICQM